MTINLEKQQPATVENEQQPATAKNVKKEGKKTMSAKNEQQPATVTANNTPVATVDPVAVKRAEINNKIKIAKIRFLAYEEINRKGEQINPTNWGKTETGTGKETLGGYVRMVKAKTLEEINGLKRELKETYFTLAPEIKALQDSNNPVLISVMNNCIENMRNVPVIKKAEGLTVEVIKLLAKAGVKELGIDPLILGVTLPLLVTNGYMYNPNSPQPVTLPEIKIEGLDIVPACTYYSFKLAE